ncbi:cytochrome C oxidase subunit IV family protein [Thalassotalea sp. M1531]|uniref:Cytochrome C oxidase subunit IV family protein n=1 Tax=Thalassotalea algicola TaxID=2716224 RepID=A0A7Y0Q7X8_9GAMM|nr:cytochrome C oxidase subunit IV family protein [Thalassotalea algicola]NMP31490.1 cytochrome C oxidase subunit IV family protein [Thalassotalea algicola]
MKNFGKLEILLCLLIIVTLFNTFLGERFSSITLASIIIAATVTYKGFVVIDNFMELKEGNKNLRFLMRLYFIIFPSMIVVSAFY